MCRLIPTWYSATSLPPLQEQAPSTDPSRPLCLAGCPLCCGFFWGGVFFGAVQDFAAMYASVKNKGRSIGYIIEVYIGKLGKRLFLLFTWLFSILVVAAFADIVAGTFNGFDAATGERIAANGAVATTSLFIYCICSGTGMLPEVWKMQQAGKYPGCHRTSCSGCRPWTGISRLCAPERMAHFRIPVCDCCLRDSCMGSASAQGLSEQLPAAGHDYRCGSGNMCL